MSERPRRPRNGTTSGPRGGHDAHGAPRRAGEARPDDAVAGGLVRGRHETAEERADRRWGELLQEVRVAQTGVQILFGFLLTVVFQPGFERLDDLGRDIYVLTVVLGAATTGALIGPVSFHRVVAGRRLKPQTVTWASRLTMLGLLLLLCTMVSAMVLILRVVVHSTLVGWLVGGMLLWFVLCWFVLPFFARYFGARRDHPGEPMLPDGGGPPSVGR